MKTDDPNPRLEAYTDAARRGTKVRILLDSVYDEPGDVRDLALTFCAVHRASDDCTHPESPACGQECKRCH